LGLVDRRAEVLWVCHIYWTHATLGWTWLTAKPKSFGSGMIIGLTLPWVWLTTKPKSFEFVMIVRAILFLIFFFYL
jgi:hypothetical protein